VGDRNFQDKCMSRIHELRRGGATIILVSHDLSAVEALCGRLVWLEEGRQRAVGPAHEVIAEYLELTHERTRRQAAGEAEKERAFRRWGTGEIEIDAVRFLDDAGRPQVSFRTGDALTVEIAYTVHRPVEEPEFGLAIFREDGVHVNGPNNRLAGVPIDARPGPGVLRYRVEELPLLPALYLVTAAVHDGQRPHAYDFHDRAYTFRVEAGATLEREGVVHLPATWEWDGQAGPAEPAPGPAR
jgi:hypothetical protein